MVTSLEKPGIVTRALHLVVGGVAAFLLFQLISLYLSWPKQIVLGSVSVVLGLAANRTSKSRVVTLALMILSMTATLRYGWWRIHLVFDFFSDESNHRFRIDSVFLLVLMSAEAYTILIMVLGYMQTMWPLRRKPLEMPNDERQWPHVDVLIPTYNEPLELVRYTALAANQIDYPPEKLHVYILDDGTREDFREFAAEAGVGYVTRKEHNHAKAGNINHALTTMDSPYVAIFDCDHVPTRSFLQMTMGWMLADEDLAMLQTPHHFYSPDPFERNLLQYKTIPSEAELFYGIVQDGNDFWNATFFCGSCALIRRSALEEVGGIATETVTEDAHTSLRLQKLGYNTAYINIAQAAGLATGSLAAHVGQRIRWARGMIQILRTDNPLLAKGMKFTQRLCYFNAMLHFMYAVPRLVFLLAPLVYMLLGLTIIPGYWVAILAYALPHLILSSMTNSRIQGRHRHSFWNEIYETVLAPYILMPTLLAMINPKLGKFNVTDKGSTQDETTFDHKIAAPTMWLLFLNFLGVLMAPYRMFIKDPQHPGTVITNLIWIFFNIVILGVAAAVAREQQQRRATVRIEVRIPSRLFLPDGTPIDGMTADMSIGGASVRLPELVHFSTGDQLRVAFPAHSGEETIGARVVGMRSGEVRLGFNAQTIAEQETLTRALYSRADAWMTNIESREVDRPMVSLARVIRLSFYGIHQILRGYLPGKPVTAKTRRTQAATTLLLTIALSLAWTVRAQNGLGSPSHGDQGAADASRAVQSAIASQAVKTPRPAAAPKKAQPDATALQPQAPPIPVDPATYSLQVLKLHDAGVANDIEMRGPHSYYSVKFTLSNLQVPRHAVLKLVHGFDTNLSAHNGALRLLLNGVPIGSLTPGDTQNRNNDLAETDVAVPEDLLVRNNVLTFEFTGSESMQWANSHSGKALCKISPSSTLEISGERIRLQNNLSLLPLPFFDGGMQTTTTVPFVFLSQPDAKALQAAGIVASWLGVMSTSKPVRFAVSIGSVPTGNVVIFASATEPLPAGLQMPPTGGASLSVQTNPSDALGSVLLVAGQSEDQVIAAAQLLAQTSEAGSLSPDKTTLNGEVAAAAENQLPAARRRDDAPRWMRVDTVAPLWNCNTQPQQRTDGSSPIPLYFHVPPDLYYGEKQNLTLRLNYRYNATPTEQGSALRTALNGSLVNEAPLLPGAEFRDAARLITVPVAAMRPFGNTLLFNFDFATPSRSVAQDASGAGLQGEVLCNSGLDLRGLRLWAKMPNLELFANAGFPFTQFADLSQTVVVMPDVPNSAEIALYLHLMSHFGTQTGYPALRVTVSGPGVQMSDDRDYLVVGTIANQPAFNSLSALMPLTFDENGIHMRPRLRYQSALNAVEAAWNRWWSKLVQGPQQRNLPSNDGGAPEAMVEELESPASADRSVVVVALKENTASEAFADVFLERSQSGDISGSASLLRGGKFASFEVDDTSYHVGNLSQYAVMRIWLTQYFLLLLIVVTALSFLLARWTRDWLLRHANERLKLSGVEVVSD